MFVFYYETICRIRRPSWPELIDVDATQPAPRMSIADESRSPSKQSFTLQQTR